MSDQPEMMQPPDAAPEQPAPPPPDPQVDKARELYDRLYNLDTRAETLDQVLKPGQDLPPGMTWSEARQALWQMQQQQPEEPDPWEQFAQPEPIGYTPDGQPVYDQPYQEQGFDPTQLQPVFEHAIQTAEERAFNRMQKYLTEQAQEFGVSQGVQQAAQQHSLSDFGRQIVETMTKNAMQQQPHRAPAEVADEMAKMYLEDANRRFVQQGGAPRPPQPGTPSGPVPGEQPPRTDAEALERSLRYLNGGTG